MLPRISLHVSLGAYFCLYLLELNHLASKVDSSLEGNTLARTNTNNTIAQAHSPLGNWGRRSYPRRMSPPKENVTSQPTKLQDFGALVVWAKRPESMQMDRQGSSAEQSDYIELSSTIAKRHCLPIIEAWKASTLRLCQGQRVLGQLV